MTEAIVRRAVADDLDRVLLLAASVAEAPHWPRSAYEQVASEQRQDVHRCLLVSYAEGRLCGFAVGSCVAGEAQLESVAVHPDARRRGLGAALCREVVAWAKHTGAQAIFLEVRAASGGARALYRRLGFVEQGTRLRYYGAPTDDAVLMRLHLPAAV